MNELGEFEQELLTYFQRRSEQSVEVKRQEVVEKRLTGKATWFYTMRRHQCHVQEFVHIFCEIKGF
jgi:hypothetical protein